MKIQRTILLLAAPLSLLLAACSAPAADAADPVWQQQLPNSGVTMELSNCTLLSNDVVPYAEGRLDTEYWMDHEALAVEGVPVITLRGVEAEQVELRFTEDIAGLYIYYDKVLPQPELDYVLTQEEDGTLQYRLDTVYNYDFIITTPEGSDSMMVICYREGLRDAPEQQTE